MTPDTDSEDADASTSSAWNSDASDYVPPDLPCHSIPQEPGSFYIGNFSVANHYVDHAAVAEPPVDGPDVHITVTLRTDIFATGRTHGEHEKTDQHVYAPSMRSLINLSLIHT